MECAVDADPTAEEGSIVKREWWNKWEPDYVPGTNTSFKAMTPPFRRKKQRTTALLRRGAVFKPRDEPDAIILLDAKRGGLISELKKLAWEEYKYWEPDCVLIEAKATGTPLTQELRRIGIPVTAYTPSRRAG